jgi:catechol 2,3-dioxygenase-like lactoylglutathione lyase family enzyme
MKVSQIHHIAINTKNIDESISFYRDVLGLEQGETVDMEDFKLTYFPLPDGGSLELFDYQGKNPKTDRLDEAVGLRHLAFFVDNVTEAEKELRKNGVTITLPTTELPSLGMRVMLFLDPNDVTLEFCEKL